MTVNTLVLHRTTPVSILCWTAVVWPCSSQSKLSPRFRTSFITSHKRVSCLISLRTLLKTVVVFVCWYLSLIWTAVAYTCWLILTSFSSVPVSVGSLRSLIKRWTSRYPDAKIDPMNVWDDIITSRWVIWPLLACFVPELLRNGQIRSGLIKCVCHVILYVLSHVPGVSSWIRSGRSCAHLLLTVWRWMELRRTAQQKS